MTVIEQREELIAWYKRRGCLLTECTEAIPYDVFRDEFIRQHADRVAAFARAMTGGAAVGRCPSGRCYSTDREDHRRVGSGQSLLLRESQG